VITSSGTSNKTLQARVFSESFVLLIGSGLVTGINFAYNIAVARFLGPTGFGHATAVYTLLILISAVTLSFQIVAAKVVAQQASKEAQSAAYRGFHRSAWLSGVFIGLLLLLARNVISRYLNLPGPILVVLLAVGVAFYVPLGSRRGYLQGSCGFRYLAGNMILEGFMRLCGSLIAILLGYGVTGVIGANAAAVAVAYMFAVHRLPAGIPRDLRVPDGFREALQAIVFFVGQVVINNCDIVVVKHFFPPTPAGLYAAVALVGRVIFAFSWAVVNTMFPIVAGTASEERKGHSVLGTSLAMVFAISATLTLGLWLAPGGIWTVLFGPQFAVAGSHTLPGLLALYAATTGVYSLSVVIIAYEMSYKIANTGWVQLAFSGVLIAGIYRFHSSLQQVILVQLVMMVILLVVVAVPFLLKVRSGAMEEQMVDKRIPIRTIRSVSEDEVIAEFLRSDFHNVEFAEYQEAFGALVATPDCNDAHENAKRRALFFIRHGSLWRELPKGTEWFEVELRSADLRQIRVFPRAQWRKLAHGDFGITEVIRSIDRGRCLEVGEQSFFVKIQRLRAWLERGGDPGVILLIGMDARGPFTILDGNHRLVAATLSSADTVKRVRFFCGLSTRMAECCWYKTSFGTLVRYAINLVRGLVHDPETELERLLQGS
jgi:O-antigen/teichoic acid export membrane protein